MYPHDIHVLLRIEQLERARRHHPAERYRRVITGRSRGAPGRRNNP